MLTVFFFFFLYFGIIMGCWKIFQWVMKKRDESKMTKYRIVEYADNQFQAEVKTPGSHEWTVLRKVAQTGYTIAYHRTYDDALETIDKWICRPIPAPAPPVKKYPIIHNLTDKTGA